MDGLEAGLLIPQHDQLRYDMHTRAYNSPSETPLNPGRPQGKAFKASSKPIGAFPGVLDFYKTASEGIDDLGCTMIQHVGLFIHVELDLFAWRPAVQCQNLQVLRWVCAKVLDGSLEDPCLV